jgi:hypothetical protein
MIIQALEITPEQAKAAMGCNRKAMLEFFNELIRIKQQSQMSS